jgi:endoglucanase
VLLRLPVDSANASSEINSLLKPAVDYATKKGLCVIVDLHYVDNPYNSVQAINSFWTTVAPMFKDYSNVFYEPFNESSVQDSWASYKPTMQAWVDLIRGGCRGCSATTGQYWSGPAKRAASSRTGCTRTAM